MASHQSPGQQKTVERVMHEFKHGELKTARGARKVKNRKQAIAIALHEAGASKYESAEKNKKNLRHTKAKERRGEIAQAEAEGKHAAKGKTRAGLYDAAKKKNIKGRSRMTKQQLEHALHG